MGDRICPTPERLAERVQPPASGINGRYKKKGAAYRGKKERGPHPTISGSPDIWRPPLAGSERSMRPAPPAPDVVGPRVAAGRLRGVLRKAMARLGKGRCGLP
jgi:hypothetical protein